MYNELKDLIGKTIKEVRIEPTNTYIQFETEDWIFSYITEGDCCSESWINHISGLQAIIGHKVLKTEEVDMPTIHLGQKGFSERQEVDQVYCFKIFTNQGVCELEMRNSSNGYYGGYLKKVDFLDCEAKIVCEDF